MNRKAFTLLELLIVIAILAVLATVAVLVINPMEYIKQSRDVKRIADVAALNKALSLAEFENLSLGGASTTVYVSLVDSVSTCANLGLPPLLAGYQYHCVTVAGNLRNVDNTGWIPVNLTALTGKSPLGSLPIDPVNDVDSFYTYIPGGSFALSASLESDKYLKQSAFKDGGTNPGKIEMGSDLQLLTKGDGLVGYWNFEEGSGASVGDISGSGNGGTWGGTGVHYGTGKVGSFAGQFSGTDGSVILPIMNYDNISVAGWFYRNAKDVVNADTGFGGWQWSADTQLRQGFDAMRFYINSDTINWVVETKNGGGIVTEKTETYNLAAASTASWHYFVGTYNATTGIQKLYIDGILRDTQAHSVGNVIVPFTAYADMRIGYSRVNNGWFNGMIDDLRVYGRALTDSEAKAIYNATK